MNNRIQIIDRSKDSDFNFSRKFSVRVDGKAVNSFLTADDAESWVDQYGGVELLRTDLAARFQAVVDAERSSTPVHTTANRESALNGICWTAPDRFVLAAAWLAESNPERSVDWVVAEVAKLI